MPHVLALSLKWEPDLHGILVIALALILLPGSVYLLLATNLGARVGFLIAAAGLFGWMSVMAIVWTVYGIGYTGSPPSWKVQEIITGNVAASPKAVLDGFPSGWHKVDVGDPRAAEAVAAADPEIAPPASTGKQGVYASSSDYLPIAAYDKGGQKFFLTLRHKPHYFVLQVEKVLAQPTVPGQTPPKAKADPTQPVTSVLMLRDLGNLRQKPAEVALFSLILFAVCCYQLHRRDKQAWETRSTALEPVGGRR